MVKISSLIIGAALGAGWMYFKDPNQGNHRQSMIRDRAMRARQDADVAVDTAVRDLRQRARGILAEGMAMISEEEVSDQVLEARVRSRLGMLARHAGAVQVNVQDKKVTLSGDILANEVDGLLSGIKKTRGPSSIENHLRVHEGAEGIPQLLGEGSLMPGETAGMQWSPSTRLLTGLGAGYMLAYGMGRGGILGALAQLGGIALGLRTITNTDIKRLAGLTSDSNVIRVRKTINIMAPVEEVYGLWSNFENFPRFMSNIEAVKDMGNGLSHWVVKAPAGTKVEFDAVITENRPNEVLSWKTLDDATVKHSGQVRFREGANEGTQVSVNMAYTPPAGLIGHAVANIFGKDPKSSMDEDLGRMKSLLEEGKTTTEGKTVNRDEFPAAKQQSSRRQERENKQIPTTGEIGSDFMRDMDSEEISDENAGPQTDL